MYSLHFMRALQQLTQQMELVPCPWICYLPMDPIPYKWAALFGLSVERMHIVLQCLDLWSVGKGRMMWYPEGAPSFQRRREGEWERICVMNTGTLEWKVNEWMNKYLTEKVYGYKFMNKTKVHKEINHDKWERLWYRFYQKLVYSVQIMNIWNQRNM